MVRCGSKESKSGSSSPLGLLEAPPPSGNFPALGPVSAYATGFNESYEDATTQFRGSHGCALGNERISVDREKIDVNDR